MIYIFQNPDNGASVVFDGNTISNEQKNNAIQLENLPENIKLDNQRSSLMCDKSTNDVWYDYFDIQNKTEIDISDLLSVTFKWLKWSNKASGYIEDTENTTPFQVEVSGQIIDIAVGETLEFTSEEPGTYTIQTTNVGCINNSVEVVVSA